MAYFNHAFSKTFLVTTVETADAQATSTLASQEVGVFDGADWTSITSANLAAGTFTGPLLYFVAGSFHSQDKIGNNPGHGGYTESIFTTAF